MNSFPDSLVISIIFLFICIPKAFAQNDPNCDEAYRILLEYALNLERQNQEYSDGLLRISNSLDEWLQSSTDSTTWNLIDHGISRLGALDSTLQITNLKFTSQIYEMRIRNQTLDSLNMVFDSQIRSMKKLKKGKLIFVGGLGFLVGALSYRVFIRPGS